MVSDWRSVALAYVSYLAVVSLTHRSFARARLPLFIAAVVAWSAFAALGRTRLSPAFSVVVPSLVLLAGYWLSGLLFVQPNVHIERWLQSVDQAALTRPGILAWYRRAPRAMVEYFELSYLLVYAAVPAGATTLIVGGHGDAIGRFWTIVLLAEFACYGLLPWIQTRPPRVLESGTDAALHGPMARLNRRIVDRASIQANTIPSGHAAGACATALAVVSTMPIAGAVLMMLAISIAAATVLGRYHYLVDTILGLAVAIAAWTIA